jgi:hypothetical protein
MVNNTPPPTTHPPSPPHPPPPGKQKINGPSGEGWVKSLRLKAPRPLRRVVGISPPREAPKIYYAPRRFTIDQKEQS